MPTSYRKPQHAAEQQKEHLGSGDDGAYDVESFRGLLPERDQFVCRRPGHFGFVQVHPAGAERRDHGQGQDHYPHSPEPVCEASS
jgi:hypothetical protein